MSQVLKGNPAIKQAGPGAQGITIQKQPQQVPIQHSMPSPVNPAAAAMPGTVPPPAVAATVIPNSTGNQMAPPVMQTIAPSNGAVAQSNGTAPVATSNGSVVIPGDEVASNGTSPDDTMANTKEKTPMCLINELARYNKIQHQYTLTDEIGPAHKKTFFVKLKLGDEEYAASGPSIKKAQHAAAKIALEKSQFKHPPPKPFRKGEGGMCFSGDSMTPTVELNALVMKRGEPAVYRNIEMPRPQYYPPPNLDFRGMYNQRYHYPRFPRVFYVSLKVGQREFIGEGNTRQSARHNAAEKALMVLRNLPLPNEDSIKPVQMTPEEGEDDDALKSEISLVHEIALRRNLPVNFEVTRESGPPHMRTFVTRCSVGDLVTEGEGNGKKISKKRAAEKMLTKLQELPSLPPSITRMKRPAGNKKKNRNLIKLQKADPSYGVGINPISRLIQIQQAKKEKEPVYTLVAERGMPRRKEFVMQVQVGDHTCTGVGPNKKLAKRDAAEAMLQLLGYSRPSPQPSKPAIKSGDGQVAGADKKVKFVDQDGNPSKSRGRQPVPGVLLMPEGARPQGVSQGYNMGNQSGLNRAPGGPLGQGMGMPGAANFSPQTTAAIAKELLDTGSSPTAESLLKSGTKPVASQTTVRPKQQLLYLADVLGFQVQFTDFPKGSKKKKVPTATLR